MKLRVLLPLVLCAALLWAMACGSPPDTVRGVVVEATDRNLAEIETLVIRDTDGNIWTFTTEEALEKNGAHLRLHQVLGETIQVRYREENGRLIAVELRD